MTPTVTNQAEKSAHIICRLPIGQVGQKRADKAGDRDRTSMGLSGMLGDRTVERGLAMSMGANPPPAHARQFLKQSAEPMVP